MYSEISACPCHPLTRITSHLLLCYNYIAPYLNHPRGYFCGPVASALLSTFFLIIVLAATILLFSNARAQTHTRTRTHARTHTRARRRACLGRPLLSLAFVIPSPERLTNLGELERETESRGAV